MSLQAARAENLQINNKGGLRAIVISHPHYYTTCANWAHAFQCPLFISADDQGWLCQKQPSLQTMELVPGPAGTVQQILPGVTAIKAGGHFPGSLVLHWEKKLFIADTLVTVPVSADPPAAFFVQCESGGISLFTVQKSAYSPHPRPPGQTSYSFQWSIPNMIPLPPSDILQIWRAIEPFDFDTTLGAFEGMDVRDTDLKMRVLESMQIQTRGMGWVEHEILDLVL